MLRPLLACRLPLAFTSRGDTGVPIWPSACTSRRLAWRLVSGSAISLLRRPPSLRLPALVRESMPLACNEPRARSPGLRMVASPALERLRVETPPSCTSKGLSFWPMAPVVERSCREPWRERSPSPSAWEISAAVMPTTPSPVMVARWRGSRERSRMSLPLAESEPLSCSDKGCRSWMLTEESRLGSVISAPGNTMPLAGGFWGVSGACWVPSSISLHGEGPAPAPRPKSLSSRSRRCGWPS